MMDGSEKTPAYGRRQKYNTWVFWKGRRRDNAAISAIFIAVILLLLFRICILGHDGSAAADVGSAVERSSGAADMGSDSGEDVGLRRQKNLRLAGSTSMEEMANALAEGFMEKYPDVIVTVEFVGSSAGVEALTNGKAEIANLSREFSREERAEGLAENIVAIDGIVLCVDPANTVVGLTVQQLRDIYTGRIRNWQDVGGQNLPIVTIGREAGSGTREAFERLFDLEEKCSYANIMDSTGAVMARVSRTPGAIGYMSLDGAGDETRVLPIDGVEPVLENISTGKYFLSRPYIMAVKGEMADQSSLVRAWFDYVYSSEGQGIIERAGLVPLPKGFGSESFRTEWKDENHNE